MLKDNLVMLRRINGYSQEDIASMIDISRQAYAKWEKGLTVPDIEKCQQLANIYNISIDMLVNLKAENNTINSKILTPNGKNIWGSININDRGQIVIPKGARDIFNLKAGTRLIVLSDEEGIALVKAERFEEHIQEIIALASKNNSQ